MSMRRLLSILAAGLVVGGLGAIYVWSAMNALLRGELTWERGLSAFVVAAALVVVLRMLARYVRHLEQPR